MGIEEKQLTPRIPPPTPPPPGKFWVEETQLERDDARRRFLEMEAKWSEEKMKRRAEALTLGGCGGHRNRRYDHGAEREREREIIRCTYD